MTRYSYNRYDANLYDANLDWSGYALSGRYKLLNVIATGGFGKVYKAADLSLPGSPFVAIKCIARLDPDSRRNKLLIRELNLHRKVSSHPNILTFHEHFKTSWAIWMLLDFCDGGDLGAAIVEGRFYNNEELVKQTMVQLIDALQYCHDNNVQHNDLKPANVLLGLDNHIYLADFGIASETPVSEGTGCGTAPYLSPEALGFETKSRPFSTVHSDIWALGIILINILTGHNPWHIATSTDVEFASFIKDPEFLYKTLSISEGVHDILRPVLTMNPLARTPLPELRKQILSAANIITKIITVST
ncbi:kinase-like domain-containing protein [Mycena floridula]|nr:kinase-like domain-containing protein [Mycena floridula]